MTNERRDEQGRRILKTFHCPTPYCYGSQEIVEAPESMTGELIVGGCRCRYLTDEVEFELWQLAQAKRAS